MTAPTLIGPAPDEVIDHLTIVEFEQHLDDDVPCMMLPCDNAATWAVRCPSCGLDWTLCNEDRATLDLRLATWATSIRCEGDGFGCGDRIPLPLNWRPL